MQQQDHVTPPVTDAKPQWEAPELVAAEVNAATLNGGSTQFDAGTQS